VAHDLAVGFDTERVPLPVVVGQHLVPGNWSDGLLLIGPRGHVHHRAPVVRADVDKANASSPIPLHPTIVSRHLGCHYSHLGEVGLISAVGTRSPGTYAVTVILKASTRRC